MITSNSSTGSKLPNHLIDTYLKDYDVPTLESLVRNMGEEIAAKVLKNCAEECGYQINRAPHPFDYEHLDLWSNIMFLRAQILARYKGHQGAIQFGTEMEEHVQSFRGAETSSVEEIAKIQTFDKETTKVHVSREVFRACYLLGWIYQTPRFDMLVGPLNSMLAGDIAEQLPEEMMLDKAPESMQHYRLVLSLEALIRIFSDDNAMTQINAQLRRLY